MKIMKRHLGNQRGDALIVALIMTIVGLLTGLTVMSYSRLLDGRSKSPRIKSMMTSLEANVRSALLDPSSYSGCVSQYKGAGRSQCKLIDQNVLSLTRVIPGVACPAEKPNCGILVTKDSFDPTFTTPTGQVVSRAVIRIHYEGTDFPLKDVVVTEDIPADILQSDGIYRCPQTAPRFKGFDAKTGQIDCEEIPAATPAGQAKVTQFMNYLNNSNFEATYTTLPANAACSDLNQYMDYVNWGLGGTQFQTTCRIRPNPFHVFGFKPKVDYEPSPN